MHRNMDDSLPVDGTASGAVIQQLHATAPATVATTGGRYFGYVVAGATPPAMGAAILNAVWEQVSMLETSSPVAIHLERIAAK